MTAGHPHPRAWLPAGKTDHRRHGGIAVADRGGSAALRAWSVTAELHESTGSAHWYYPTALYLQHGCAMYVTFQNRVSWLVQDGSILVVFAIRRCSVDLDANRRVWRSKFRVVHASTRAPSSSPLWWPAAQTGQVALHGLLPLALSTQAAAAR